jgi:hypothetical protein
MPPVEVRGEAKAKAEAEAEAKAKAKSKARGKAKAKGSGPSDQDGISKGSFKNHGLATGDCKGTDTVSSEACRIASLYIACRSASLASGV